LRSARGDLYGELMKSSSEDGNRETDERRSAALIGLIIVLALAIAGVVLVRELREKSRLEDCLMSGRTNCAPIEAPLRRLCRFGTTGCGKKSGDDRWG
jgi:hypothetical protein